MIALGWAIVRKLPWKLIGLAVAVLGLLWAVDAHGRHSEAAKWRPRLEASQRDLGIARANVAVLTASLSRQNAAVEALHAESARRTAAAEKAATEAHRETVAASEKAGRVMSLTPGADRCSSAFELMRRGG